jgi:predicted nucleotidyltransferase component of viral defense system
MKSNITASIQDRLKNLSKNRKEEYNYVLNRYGAERLLYRLSQSPCRREYILKGATLFKIWSGEEHRPTRDLDFLSFGSHKNIDIEHIFRELCLIECQEDGVIFLPASVKGEIIKQDQQYEGVRIKLMGKLGSHSSHMQIDIGFGDVVTPDAKEEVINTILGMPEPVLKIYPRETVIAEKFQAIVDLGIINSRLKDFYDIWYLCKSYEFCGDLLYQAIKNTFERRKTSIPMKEPLAFTAEFIEDPEKQRQWIAFLKKLNKDDRQPRFDEIVTTIKDFLIPPCIAITQDIGFDKVWNVTGYWHLHK